MRSRNRRTMAWLAGAVVVGGPLLGLWVTQPAQAVSAVMGTAPGTVALNPASGPTNTSPTWATTTACATGFQGSAIFRIVEHSGATTSISGATNSVTAPFHGTLLDPISIIKSFAGIPNGGTAELVVICYSGDSLTGNSHPEMDTFITFSASGSTYTTSAVAPAAPIDSQSPSTTSGTGSGSGSGSGTGSGSGSSSSGVTPSPSTTLVTLDPTSSPSPVGSPSPLNSNFAVTG